MESIINREVAIVANSGTQSLESIIHQLLNTVEVTNSYHSCYITLCGVGDITKRLK